MVMLREAATDTALYSRLNKLRHPLESRFVARRWVWKRRPRPGIECPSRSRWKHEAQVEAVG